MDTPAARYIRLRWPGGCAGCNRELQRGDWAWHDKASRSVSCSACVSPPLGVAGAGARARYEHLRAAREQRARERFGGLGVAVSRLVGDPQQTAAWKIGAEGEERLAARLAELLDGTGTVLLHDRRIPMSVSNIDHLAVGPGGVTVIDAKNLKGDVRVERCGGLLGPRVEKLRVGGRDRSKLVKGVERQVSEVSAALADLGFDRVGVTGALCFVKTDGLPLMSRLQIRDVPMLGPRGAAQLAARPGALPSAMVETLAERLAVRLPPAPVAATA